MYKEHPVFTPPPLEATLWRYMDFTRFVSLLAQSGLFFVRADKLGDPFEGSLSKTNIAMRPILYKGIPPSTTHNMANFVKGIRRFTSISCWHSSDHESAAMWRLYSRESDGVAIKTDFKGFRDSFTGNDDIFIGKVGYVDYATTFINEGNSFGPYLNKRRSFQHENEVRALTQKIPSHNGQIDFSQDAYDVGVYYEVDLSLLVKEVIVAPYAEDWLVELVQSVAARYTLKAPVRRSALGETPTWG